MNETNRSSVEFVDPCLAVVFMLLVLMCTGAYLVCEKKLKWSIPDYVFMPIIFFGAILFSEIFLYGDQILKPVNIKPVSVPRKSMDLIGCSLLPLLIATTVFLMPLVNDWLRHKLRNRSDKNFERYLLATLFFVVCPIVLFLLALAIGKISVSLIYPQVEMLAFLLGGIVHSWVACAGISFVLLCIAIGLSELPDKVEAENIAAKSDTKDEKDESSNSNSNSNISSESSSSESPEPLKSWFYGP